MGGGIVKGSLSLFGGEPGIGKSTLMLQVGDGLTKKEKKVLYVSGEESLPQVADRAKRLGVDARKIDFLDSMYLEKIENVVRHDKYDYVIIDSVQTLVSSSLSGGVGSIMQIKYCVAKLMQLAKSMEITILLVGHVTKQGEVAGPKILEHLVDVVLYFEGDRLGDLRILRALKNRYGAIDETGVFVMTSDGLKSVADISKMFLRERITKVPGSVVSVAMEGTRPFLVEIQAIADSTSFGNPKRTSVGVDMSRLSMLLAILGKRADINVHDKDVYVNVVGGFKLKDRSTDLAVLAAIASVIMNRVIDNDVVVFGEVGLLGEVRRVKSNEHRVREAINMGFKRIYCPRGVKKDAEIVVTVEDLFKKIF
jgi:DNA repair protein RadA/Sms